LVLHGGADPLVTLSGGEATAAAVPSAKLITYPGMGHDLPEILWNEITEAIAANTALAAA
jgi:pimeloyl-ACP methyl ester carboxylesterase